ncbi:pyridoxal phosphate-dependent aminotransferase [Fusibacter sp. JL216-2]|uniref:pyridoxal phosphate-dependent aminotransferase n=1 Tax=Fusibacter sp. JL216-2 TaxID=3071453 RepID=UPI003D34B1FE
MSNFSMVAPHSKRPVEPDRIFGASKAAQEAAEKYGFENVTNSTIGAMMDDNGNLIFLDSVMDHIRGLTDAELAAYAPIAGLPEYLQAVQEACFRGYEPNGHIRSVATPGGTGAIKHAVWNYTNFGDAVLTSDWYWAPYKTICEEHGRDLVTYNVFREDGNFDIDAFHKAFDALLEKQDQVLVIINAPAHNPTGFSLEDSEWEEVMQILRKGARNPEKKVVLFADVAYIDFAGTVEETRSFMKYFNDLPENLLVLIGFSMSKGYTLYGMRSGAIICVAKTEEIAEEFKAVCSFSNRAAWSNGTRAAMRTLADIFSDDALFAKVESEREVFRELLDKRSGAFMEEAEKIGLKTCPFKSGFFISMPCKNPQAVAEEIKKDNLYLVALAKGIRFAPCAVSEEKCRKAPAIIKKAMEALGEI